jgi:predicted MPP superfamily phosphohydrolase
MFFQIIFATYLILNIIVYFRLRTFFRKGGPRALFLLAYLLLILAFPAAEIIIHRTHSAWSQPVYWLGILALPFQLYLFLTLLLLELAWAGRRIVKRVPNTDRYNVPWRSRQLWTIGLLPAFIIVIGLYNFNHITVNRYHIQIAQKASGVSHLRLALASDFHLNETTNIAFIQDFVDKINGLQVDALLIPGDMLEGDGVSTHQAKWEKQLAGIKTTYGAYATLGNHESYGRRINTEFFRDAHITLLQDTVLTVDSAFVLAGRKDNRFSNRQTMASLSRTATSLLPVIVMDHRPTDLEAIATSAADIAVSGHTHYGQLIPLNFIVNSLYELSWGYKKIRNTHVFVTCGIQGWGPPVRTAGVSEIMVIDVDLLKER